jgi:uncharacterized protein YbbC (DUF1343 family)
MKPSWLILTFLVIFLSCRGQTSETPNEPAKEIEKPLILAVERLDTYLPMIKDKDLALAVNHTSLLGDRHIVDTLLSLGVNIKKVFAPEHGFRGAQEAGETVQSGIDPKTSLPIVSLYGSNKKPTADQVADIDIILFDIQDVGARFYTYISTMHYLMEACAENGKTMMVLDRPNPNGDYVDGPILEEAHQSFIGMHPIPIVHGLTVGELALMINGENWLAGGAPCELEVVPMENYHHQLKYEPPVKPSPNLPNYQSIRLYPSLCFFERTPISLGRGTEFPFQVYGHPDFDQGLFQFTPTAIKGMDNNPKHKDQPCYGWDLREVEAPKLTLRYLIESYQLIENKADFFMNGFNLRSGNSELAEQLKQGLSEAEIKQSWNSGLERYRQVRSNYLLYPDTAP